MKLCTESNLSPGSNTGAVRQQRYPLHDCAPLMNYVLLKYDRIHTRSFKGCHWKKIINQINSVFISILKIDLAFVLWKKSDMHQWLYSIKSDHVIFFRQPMVKPTSLNMSERNPSSDVEHWSQAYIIWGRQFYKTDTLQMLLLPLKEGLSITPYCGGLLFIVCFSWPLRMQWEVRGGRRARAYCVSILILSLNKSKMVTHTTESLQHISHWRFFTDKILRESGKDYWDKGKGLFFSFL